MGKRTTSTTFDTAQPPGPATPSERVDCLEILFTPDPDRRGWRRPVGREPLEIGRRVADHHLQLNDSLVSKLHAEVTWSPARERYLVTDRGSSNGTWLDGVRIERELLAAGSLLRIGDTVLRLVALEPIDLAAPPTLPADGLLAGRSRAMVRAVGEIERAALSPLSVLLLGETGTGKELLAQTLHERSRRPGPLKAVNCAALPRELVEAELFGHLKGAFSGADAARPGLFRAADGGTLFLDEVGELSPPVQAVLLRVLETRTVRAVGSVEELPVDVRLVAATNRPLEADARAGRFRPDLYARLADWVVDVPPLRERPDDLEPLIETFLARYGGGRSYRLSGELFEALALYDWPYNVRELHALIRRLVLLLPEGGPLGIAHLPDAMRRTPPATAPAAALAPSGPPERRPPDDAPTPQELRRLVEEFSGNIKEVAAFLGKERMQVYRWLRRYGIDPAGYR